MDFPTRAGETGMRKTLYLQAHPGVREGGSGFSGINPPCPESRRRVRFQMIREAKIIQNGYAIPVNLPGRWWCAEMTGEGTGARAVAGGHIVDVTGMRLVWKTPKDKKMMTDLFACGR
jgi:hypothetical protein